MKRKIAVVALIAALSLPSQAEACSFCARLEKALKEMRDWAQASICLSQRTRIAQVFGGPIMPCDHNPKHDSVGGPSK